MRLAPTVVCVLLAAACNKTPPEVTPSPDPASSSPPTTPATPAAPQAPAAAAGSAPSSAKPPVWTDPPSWTKGTPKSSMRAAEYAVPHAAGDTEDAECVVYHFGAGQGGSADDNIARWKGQFTDGTPPAVQTKEVAGMKVTRLELSGTYSGGMPAPGQAPAGPKKNQRMVAAVVEAPAGSWFFKLTGSDATVKAASPAFDAMIASLH
jgi:hypothetical protein